MKTQIILLLLVIALATVFATPDPSEGDKGKK